MFYMINVISPEGNQAFMVVDAVKLEQFRTNAVLIPNKTVIPLEVFEEAVKWKPINLGLSYNEVTAEEFKTMECRQNAAGSRLFNFVINY